MHVVTVAFESSSSHSTHQKKFSQHHTTFQGRPILSRLVSVYPPNVRNFLWPSVGRSSPGFVRSMERVAGCPHRALTRYIASLLRSAASAVVDYAFCQCLYGPPTSLYRPTGIPTSVSPSACYVRLRKASVQDVNYYR